MKAKSDGGFLSFTPTAAFEGLPQLNIGPIEGGISRTYNKTRPALFPDVCTITVDFRLIPGMSKESLTTDLRELLDTLREEEPDFRYELEFARETFPIPFHAPRDSRIVHSVASAHEAIHGEAPAWSRIRSFIGHAGVVSSTFTWTCDPSTRTSFTMFRVTMSLNSSGSRTVRNAAITSSRCNAMKSRSC